MQYVSPKQASEIFNVSEQTLRRWEEEGQIEAQKTHGGHRRYKIIFPNKEGTKFIYARVSSRKQSNDLERQVKFLKDKYKGYEVITDIGSGINFKRKGFKSILEQLFEKNVSEVVVAYSDRWSRFGFEFFQWMFYQHGAQLISISEKQNKSETEELSEDLMSIITVFTARYYGQRKYNILTKNKDIS